MPVDVKAAPTAVSSIRHAGCLNVQGSVGWIVCLGIFFFKANRSLDVDLEMVRKLGTDLPPSSTQTIPPF